MKYTEEQIKKAFREREAKTTALLVRVQPKAKEIIEAAAYELDLDTAEFVRQALEEKLLKLIK